MLLGISTLAFRSEAPLISDCDEIRGPELLVCLAVTRQIDQVARRRNPRQSHPIAVEQIEEVTQIRPRVDVAAPELECDHIYKSALEHVCRPFEHVQFVSLHVQLQEVDSRHALRGAVFVNGIDGDSLAQSKLDAEVVDSTPSQR